jgi:hypothetical protein
MEATTNLSGMYATSGNGCYVCSPIFSNACGDHSGRLLDFLARSQYVVCRGPEIGEVA